MGLKEKSLSMPYWCVANPVGDPFGGGVLDRLNVLETTDLLCEAKEARLIEYTSAHDDDLVPWNPENPFDDQDPQSDVYRTLKAIREKIEKVGLRFNTVSCNLHEHPLFRNGGLANPDPRVRLFAWQKVMRALRIGAFLGARYCTYWVARDGFECQFAVPWEKTFDFLKEGLSMVRRYVEKQKLPLQGGTIEHKPNEPRGEMFLPTVGHTLALIGELEDPDFWGVNPEVLQHDQMTGLTSIGSVAFALSMGKLFFLHVGNQKPNQFDNDNPPLIGMDGIKELISVIYLINRWGWDGVVEFDNHMLRTDATPGTQHKIEVRREYISLTVDAYRLAERKAHAILADEVVRIAQEKLWRSDAKINEILERKDLEEIASARLDYRETLYEKIQIGYLDLLVNQKMLGDR
jgi:xylose isomerase